MPNPCNMRLAGADLGRRRAVLGGGSMGALSSRFAVFTRPECRASLPILRRREAERYRKEAAGEAKPHARTPVRDADLERI